MLHTTALVRSALVVPGTNESTVMEAVLEIVDSLMTYRTRYLTTLQAGPLLDLLLTDETNPRSIAFQLSVLANTCGTCRATSPTLSARPKSG